MKLLIILAAVSLTSCDKLDRTYLPPSYAQTSGGSGNFLQTPNFANQPADAINRFDQSANAQSANQYPQGANDFAPTGNDFAQIAQNDYVQSGNRFPQGDNGFAQNGNGFAQGADDFAQNGNGFAQSANGFAQNDGGVQRAERARAAFERTASILRQDSQNDGETFSYSFETDNGITAEESGVATNGVEAQGGFSYTGDDGQVYSIRYTADQNGFVPQGDHLPTPPPVPEEILKALEQNARDEANGIFDDGSYQEGKYADSEDVDGNGNRNYNNNGDKNYNNGEQNLNNGAFQNFNSGNQNYADATQTFGSSGIDNSFARDDDTVVTNSAANNAYLPPVADQSPVIRNQRPQNLNQRPSAANQIPAVRNQRPEAGDQRQTVANTAYLPPLDNQRIAAVRNQRPQGNQGNLGVPQRNKFGSNGVTNAYLPPRDQGRRPATYNNQAAPLRSSNNGFVSSPVSNGFGQRSIQRRPTFNARDGYQY